MNTQKTRIGIAAIFILCGAYVLTDAPSDLSTVSAFPDRPTNQESGTAKQEAILIDTRKLKEPSSNNDTLSLERFSQYSNTFATTEEYEAASRFGKLPTHMTDVRIEELAFDANNALIVNEKVKNLIEFFLLAKDSEGTDQAIERLKEYIELTLPSPAKEQALAISEQYLTYKDKLQVQQFSDNTNLSDEANIIQIKLALEERKKTRREYLGEQTSQDLFGYEEQYDDFSMQRLEINANSSLTRAEKDQKIAQAEQKLPSELATKMRYKREKNSLERKISTLKQSANNETEIFELRKDFYGEKVAERLAYLEDQSPSWQQRMNEFYQEQASIHKDNSLTEGQKKQKIKALREQSFTYKEQVKLAVQSIRG